MRTSVTRGKSQGVHFVSQHLDHEITPRRLRTEQCTEAACTPHLQLTQIVSGKQPYTKNPSLSVPWGFKGDVPGSTVLNLMDVINNKSSYQAKGGICFPDGVPREPQKQSRVGVPPKQTFKGLEA